VSVLSSLFGRKQPRNRPDLEPWTQGAGALLVVDGSGPGLEPAADMFPEQTVLRHETTGGPGVPFHFPDPRRPPHPDGKFDHFYGSVVLADVFDKVIDVGAAVDAAMEVVICHGELVVVQAVGPDDFEQRAIWNAIARMRDPRHASTPSSRQLGGIISGLKMEIVHEAIWDEAVDPALTLRPEFADRLALMIAAATARGATEVLRDGALVVERRAWRLRRAD